MTTESTFHRKPFTMIGSLVFLLVGIVHAVRVVYGAQIMIGDAVIPLWASYVGTIIGILLGVMLWRENIR